jgi:hydrogenase nickel incorporation protein HypA/HybF
MWIVHELSIAISLVDVACEKAADLGGPRVLALHLRLGALSGVVKEALLFAYDAAARDTRVAGARLEIEEAPGRELELAALEVEDDA